METILYPKPKTQWYHLANVVLFTGFLAYFGLVFFMQDQLQISHVEKRKLTRFPDFKYETLKKGLYTKQIDLFIADHFPLREFMVEFTFTLKNLRGFKTKETFYAQSVVTDSAKEQKQLADTSTTLNAEEDFLEEDAQLQKGLLITESGKALQLFGGSDKKARAYADMVSEYHKKLGNNVSIYNMIIPCGADFYLPKKYKEYAGKEKRHIDTVAANVPANTHSIDVFTALKKHKKEYLFFRTDHHWTGLGAYHAYTAFCNEAGFKAIPLDSTQHLFKTGFLGSLYAQTRDPKLKENADTLHYYKVPYQCKVEFTTKNNQTRWNPGMLYAERAKGSNLYSLFLASDYPLMRIESPVKNGRTAMVIKNSYGNAFVPYLVCNYEKVVVVDYRYYTQSVLALIEQEKVNDLLFVIGSFSSNNLDHINRIRKIMYGK